MNEIIISPMRSMFKFELYEKERKKNKKKYKKKDRPYYNDYKPPVSTLKKIQKIGKLIMDAITNRFKRSRIIVDNTCLQILSNCLLKI